MNTRARAAIALTLALLLLSAVETRAQIFISTVTNTGYRQNFDALASSGASNPWANNATLPGWYASQAAAPFAVTNYRASSGSDTAGSLYSFGSASAPERALGSLPSGTPGNLAYGVRFTNDTALAMTNVTITYTGEQWRRVANGGIQTLAFAHLVSSGMIANADAVGTNYSWTAVSALDFNSPNLGPTGAIDGNAATNRHVLAGSLAGVLLPPGHELFLRWLDVNDLSGSDYGLAVDDLTVAFTPVTFSDPTITLPPASRTNAVQTAATFSVGAVGQSTLRYQWFKGALPLTNGVNLSGATAETLVLSQVRHADAGSYSVIVSSAAGSRTSAPVTLTVVGFTIAPVGPTNTLAGTPVSVGVSFLDNQSGVNSLAGTSSNPGILANASILGAAAGSAGSVTLTPSPASHGVALVTLTASDGAFTASTVFPLLVVPSANVLFNDHFDYPDGSVTAVSCGLWRHHSGPAGESIVTNGELCVSRSFDEDVNALLLGAPYESTSGMVLYSKFKLRFVLAPTTNGNYFAHFKDASGSGLRGRIWASTASGHLRLAIGNASTNFASAAEFPLNLELGTNYTVVSSLCLSNGLCSLWLNPASEADPHVTASDALPSLLPVSTYAFRQDSGQGILYVDDLVVGTSFAAVMGASAPLPEHLTATVSAGKLILNWSQPNWSGLLSGPSLNALTTTNRGVASPFTNVINAQPTFYRLFWTP
jgi:hypothetical protein